MTATRTAAPAKPRPAPKDAIALLKADHKAVNKALKDKLLVPEATVEHAGVKDLVAQLEGAAPDGVMYDAKVKVLSEYVKHHVKEEQNEMFPKLKATSIDMVELGARMAARKDELLAQAA